MSQLMVDIRKPLMHYSLHVDAVISSQPNDVTILFGRSGCGKTTLLRCLAGLARPREGWIRWASEVWFDASQKIHRTPQVRQVGMLFQDPLLFPKLTVQGNIAMAATRSGHQKAEGGKRSNLLERLEIGKLIHRYPHQLSRGEQQRVAVARMLASRPRFLLMDEPFSALDTSMRHRFRRQVKSLLQELEIPSLLVTHDPEEAMDLGAWMLVMDEGRVQQIGSMQDVFLAPSSLPAAEILGWDNRFRAQVNYVSGKVVVIQIGSVILHSIWNQLGILDKQATATFRSSALGIGRSRMDDPTAKLNQWESQIESIHPEGPAIRIGVSTPFPLEIRLSRHEMQEARWKEGESLWVRIHQEDIRVYST